MDPRGFPGLDPCGERGPFLSREGVWATNSSIFVVRILSSAYTPNMEPIGEGTLHKQLIDCYCALRRASSLGTCMKKKRYESVKEKRE